MSYVFDCSFGHAQMTPTAVKSAGADGVILYAGCGEVSKNATKPEVQALVAAGVHVGLVIENFAADAIGGAPVGTSQGKAIFAAAGSLGYDRQNCALFAGYDTDSHAADWPKLLAFMEAFAAVVPVPGYYGDSDSIDYLAARHPDWIFWQSMSGSYSPLQPTPNASLWQRYNDARAYGLPVDVNNVLRTPLRLMGEDMALTDSDAGVLWGHSLSDGTVTQSAAAWLKQARDTADSANTKADALAAQVKALQSQVSSMQTAGVDPAALAKEIAAHVAVTLAAK